MTTRNETITTRLDLQTVLNSINLGVLVFDAKDRLVLDNRVAEQLLGIDLPRIRRDGWGICSALLDAGKKTDAPETDEIRARALREGRPIRFNTTLAEGTFTPGWILTITLEGDGEPLTMVCLEIADWTALTELMGTFRNEARQAITATRGSAELISKMAVNRPKDMRVDQLAGRVLGFSEMIISHMYRFEMLMELLHRWEIILTGRLAAEMKARIKRIELADWFEDFLEALLDQTLIDPEVGNIDYRERLVVNVPEALYVSVSKYHLGTIVRDLLRNAMLYSEQDTPIILQAVPLPNNRHIRIDVIDRGCGVRKTETSRVFEPFQRARQPHIIGQFGYGLSLHLCKAEIEAMGGSVTFNSEEGMGSVFSLLLQRWHDEEESP